MAFQLNGWDMSMNMNNMRQKRVAKILAVVLTATVISGSTVPVGAEVIKLKQNDTRPLIQGEYVPGDAVICVRGSEKEIEEVTADTAFGDYAQVNESEFLMDVSEAEDLFVQGTQNADDEFDVTAENAEDSSMVLKLVHSDTLSTEELIELYSKKPEVLFAEPNYVYKPEAIEPENADIIIEPDIEDLGESSLPADKTPDFSDVQFAYGNVAGGMDVPDWNDPAKDNAAGVVAVLDSGVDYTNEDLKNVMWDEGLNYPTLTALGGGKYGINTGYEYYEGNHKTEKNDPIDLGGHGTHCAGIIAAEWNNIGISGAANGARIMAIKHDFNDEGSSSSVTSIKGLNYILAAKEAGVNVVAVNCSFGGPAGTLAFACSAKELGEKGIVTCVASGNESEDIDIGSSSPSMFTGVPQLITVNSMDKEGKASDFSNWGIRNTHLYAPGTGIISTFPTTLPSAYPYPDEHRSKPVKVSGNELAVSFNEAPSIDSPFKFNLTPADIDFSAGEMRIRNTERDPRIENFYFGKAFSVSVNLPRPEEGRHYYLIFSKRVESDTVFCFPVLANRRSGGRTVLGENLSHTYRNYSYEKFMIDEEEFDIEHLELEFNVYNPLGNDPAPEAAIGEMWITDEAYPYVYLDGTSMATPAVAGEVAILAKEFPDDSAAKRAARIVAGVKKVDDFSDLCITGGAANVRNSLDESKYTPVINSISTDEQHIYINGFFFGENPDISISQGEKTWSSPGSLSINSVMTDTDGSEVITVDFPGNGLIRDEEVKVTVTDTQKPAGRQDFLRILPLHDDSEESTEDGSLYKRMPLSDAAKEALSPVMLFNATCLNGSIYYLCENEVTGEQYSLRYQNGTFSKTEDAILYSGHIAQWNGMLVYADYNRVGDLIFHDGNRIVKTKEFVPFGTEVPVSDNHISVFDPPGESDRRIDLYYDGRDFIFIRGMTITDKQTGEPVEDISAVYRLDPYTCRGTFLGELKNVYEGGIVITHEEKADSPNTFYIIGSGSDENGAGCDFVGEKFTVSPSFNSEVINSAAPLDFRFNPNEHWNGCGVKNGIYLTGAHTVKGDGNIKYIEADNYFYDYSDPSAGFVKCPKKISDMTVYHPLVTACDNKVTFLAMDKEEYRMCTTDCETLPAYGDIPLPPSDDNTDYTDIAKDTNGLSGNVVPVIENGRDEKGNVTETVKIGGEEVLKKVTDPKSGKASIESKVWIAGLEKTYTYTGSAIKPSIHVYDGTRKLIENTDYTLSYKNNKKVGANAEVIIRFRGSYSSAKSQTAGFEIVKAELGKDIIAHDTGTADEKKIKKTAPALTWAETGKPVNSRYFTFEYSDIDNNESIVTIRPKSNSKDTYDKETTAKVKIVSDNNLLMSNAKVVFDQKSYVYTGKVIIPSYKVTIGKETLVKDVDFIETIYNGINPGTATVMIEAKPENAKGYVGSRTETFKITGKRAINDSDEITVEVSNSVPFAKGGAKAAVFIMDGDTELKEGVDYTLSYTKNRAVTNGATAEVKITGTGNYKGTVTKKFAVVKQDLSKLEGNVIITDQFTSRNRLKKPSVTITDLDGKKLAESKDYTVVKFDASDPSNTDESGTVKVTISAKESGAYKGRLETSFRYMKPKADIGKAMIIKKIDDRTYTGYAVKLSDDDLNGVLRIGSKTLEPGKDFIIDKGSYRNNNKTGTARVTVIGIGDFAGRKTVSFKIKARPVYFKGKLW